MADGHWLKLYNDMPDHPKIEGLSDAAFRLLVTCWCWCDRQRTDGVVPEGSWAKKGTPKARKELLDAGLAEVQKDKSVLMHNYRKRQRSAEQIAAAIEQRRLAGRAGGMAKAERHAKRVANEPPSDSLSEMASEILPEGEGEKENSLAEISSVDNRESVEPDAEPPPLTKSQIEANQARVAAIAAGATKGAP